jgi:hypothetical protein
VSRSPPAATIHRETSTAEPSAVKQARAQMVAVVVGPKAYHFYFYLVVVFSTAVVVE